MVAQGPATELATPRYLRSRGAARVKSPDAGSARVRGLARPRPGEHGRDVRRHVTGPTGVAL